MTDMVRVGSIWSVHGPYLADYMSMPLSHAVSDGIYTVIKIERDHPCGREIVTILEPCGQLIEYDYSIFLPTSTEEAWFVQIT